MARAASPQAAAHREGNDGRAPRTEVRTHRRVARRALSINEAAFGPDHPGVATYLNIALLLQATNRLAEAELVSRRALAIDEAAFGPDHPNVARNLNNLAKLLQATNRLAKAEPLMRRALAIFETSLGPDHPSTQRVGGNLAALLQVLAEAATKPS